MSTYDTTTGGLNNAGLAEAPGQNREDVERTRDALDDVRTTGPGRARRIGRVARRRPARVAASALLLAGAAVTAMVLRRRAEARKHAGWNRVLPGFLKR